MEPNRRDGARDRRLRLGSAVTAGGEEKETERHQQDVVFDFTGLHSPQLTDLSLVLTARMKASPDERVWVRALPFHVWQVLRSLGLDHLFRVYPGPSEEPN